MRKIFDSKFQVDVYIIGQGEYFVSGKGAIVSTTLGSCISVCIFDVVGGVGGMNHYMLPEPVIEKDQLQFEKAKYGINSMEILINEILKLGGERFRLKAKIFGGANMFSFRTENSAMAVGEQNIHFAREYLAQEKIPIINSDVGEDHARKIYLDCRTGHIKLFRIGLDKRESIAHRELEYQKRIQRLKDVSKKDDLDDKFTLF